MPASDYTDFTLPRNAYTAFDAVSLKQLIINRVRDSGLFPDIDYEGSNVSGLVDIVAYTYHVLLFYLNQTASETLFNQVELYENMNKLVSLLNYKPQGYQTALLNFDFTVSENLTPGFYTLKRYSYISINNITYSFNRDISFEKTLTESQLIESVGTDNVLHQGKFKEYPLYTAVGEDFEQLSIISTPLIQVNAATYTDSNNIHVYIQDSLTKKWSEWEEVSSLYIADSKALAFEKRLNENGRFEIKFGNGITGKKLKPGDIVAVYYLESDGSAGVVGNNIIQQSTVVLYNTAQYNTIFADLQNIDLNYLNTNQVQNISLDNQYSSILPTEAESVQSIRNNVPSILSTQNRAVTVSDYESIIRKNFSNIVSSTKVLSNKEYTSTYLKYFYEIGLERPNNEERVLANQVAFSDACNFNNIYVFNVPKIGAIQNETTPITLFSAQKQAIVNKFNNTKSISHNIVVSDPIYQAFDFGFDVVGERYTIDIRNETVLRIFRSTNFIISKELLKSRVAAIIVDFFKQENNSLGQLLNFASLNVSVLSVPGVSNIQTVRVKDSVEYTVPKISVIQWDPLYPNVNVNVTSQNIQLESFQFPFFYNVSNLINKIEVI